MEAKEHLWEGNLLKINEKQEVYSDLFLNNQVPMLIINTRTGEIGDANHSACDFYGYSRVELAQMHILDINILTKEDFMQKMNEALMVKTKAHHFKHRIASGQVKDVEVRSILTSSKEWVYAVVHDITERLKANEEINLAHTELNQIFNTAADGMRVIDLDFNIVRINDTLLDLIGMNREQATGMKCYDILPGHYCHTSNCPLIRIKQGEERIECEVEKTLTEDKKVPFILTSTPFRKPNGELIGIVEDFKDITERKNYEESMKHLAYYDSLTNLPNRILFYDELTKAIASVKLEKNENKLLSIVYLDIDGFKFINDTFGHSVGDQMLKSIAKRLETVSENNCVARLSGDEFTFLLKDLESKDAIEKVVTSILESFKEPFTVLDRSIHVTASIGISIYPKDGEEPETLVKSADMAMYHVKKQGKNNFQYYSYILQDEMLRRFNLEYHLRYAIDHNEFRLQYQPQINLQTREIIGIEALCRWNHPKLGAVSPAEFIPLAEEIGAIIPLGKWVLKEACIQNKKWQDMGFKPIPIAVNLSILQLQKQDIIECIQTILQETGLEAKYLELEITESIGLDNFESHVKLLEELKQFGIRIALDDFGTGYSSLSYLRNLPIDTLKMDKSFIDNLPKEDKNKAIAKGIIDLAHGLDIFVTAEGVETEEQLIILEQYQCDNIQGYYFGKPTNAAKIESKLIR